MIFLKRYLDALVRNGYNNKSILVFLKADLDICISLRTLKRWLKKFAIKRHDPNVQPRDIASAIIAEQNGPQQHLGVRYLQHALRTRHRIMVTRDQVADVALMLNPDATLARQTTLWARRLVYCPGPNFRWCLDGYDKLKSFGFYIHGCIDEYSRRLMWLKVFITNRQPEIVCRFYLEAVKNAEVVPHSTVSDLGWEAIEIAASQMFFYSDDQRENHHHWGYSTQNVSIESYWRQHRHRSAQFWICKFQSLQIRGLFDSNPLDVNILRFIYMPFLMEDLNWVIEYHNNHLIRSQTGCIRPSGRPEYLYNFPQEFNARDCGRPLDSTLFSILCQNLNIANFIPPDYVPSNFRHEAEAWLVRNNVTVELGRNDEQTYVSLRNHFYA